MEEPSSPKDGLSLNTAGNCLCLVAALVRSHMNGLLLFERTKEQTTKQCLSPKTVTALAIIMKTVTAFESCDNRRKKGKERLLCIVNLYDNEFPFTP